MILELMNSVDKETLATAEARFDDFKNSITKCIMKYGASWADIVIDFEWHEELGRILADQSLSEKQKQCVKEMLDKYADLYGCFNLRTVQEAGEQSVEELAFHVREGTSTYRMKDVGQQYTRLALMAIDRKRDADGKFHLHEGFHKECGLKGGKLSGG